MNARFFLIAVLLLFPVTAEARHHKNHHHYRPVGDFNRSDERVVSHPSGCPHTAFCGCGASVRLFGHPVKSLFAAAAWFRFPRTSPTPGAVAVRPHHVFVIVSVNDDGTVVAYDANSGNHLTRIHTVSLSGYSVRMPSGAL